MKTHETKPVNINGAILTENVIRKIITIQEDNGEYDKCCIKEINRYLIKSAGGNLNCKEAPTILRLLMHLDDLEKTFEILAATDEKEDDNE
jgi:hypothetical protein